MEKSRQVIRRVQRSGAANFDEQMWPINAMLVLLSACLAGVIVAVSRFDDPRFFNNAWTQLSGLVIILTGMLVSTHKLQSRIKNRRMQLSIIVALFCYFWMILALYELGFSLVSNASNEDDATLGEQLIELPEYEPQSSFAQQDVLEMQENDQFDQQLEVRPQSQQHAAADRPQQNEPTTTPDVPDPNIAMTRRDAAPRRSDSPGASPSRSERADVLQLNETALDSSMPRENVVVERRLESQPTQVERNQSTDASMRQRTEPLPRPNAVATTENSALQRRDSQRPTPDVAADASPMSRSITSPQISSRSDPTLNRPLAEVAANTPAQPQPSVSSNRNELPATRQSTDAGQSTTSPEISNTQLARRDSPTAEPSVNNATQPRMTRSDADNTVTNNAPASAASEAVAEASAVNNPAAEATFQPTDTGAARSDSSVAESTPRRGGSSSSNNSSESTEVAATQLQRAGGSAAQPSLAQASPGSSPAARQSGGGLAAGSSEPVEVASTAGAANRSAAELRESTGEVGRASEGAQVAVNRRAADSGNLPSTAQGALPSTQMTRSGSQTGTGNPSVGQGEMVAINRARSGQLAGGDSAANDPSGAPSMARSTGQAPGLEESSNIIARNDGAAGGAAQRRDSGGGAAAENSSVIGESNLAANTAGGSAEWRPSLDAGDNGAGVPRRSGSSSALEPGTVSDTVGDEAVAGSRETGNSPRLADAGSRGGRSESSDNAATGRRGADSSSGALAGGADLSTGELNRGANNRGSAPQLADSGGQSAAPRRNSQGSAGLAAQPAEAAGGVEGSLAENTSGNPSQSALASGLSGERYDAELSGARRRAGGSQSGGGTGDVALVNESLSRASGGSAGSPELGTELAGRTSPRRGDTSGLPAGSAMADDPGPQPGGESVARLDVGELGPSAGEPTRGETNSLLARAERNPGAGGSRADVLGEPGQLSRLARDDSDVLDATPRRFQLDKSSGSLPSDLKAADIPTAFLDRDPGRRAELAESRGGNASSEEAVELGLRFLAAHQHEDGRWSLDRFASGKGYRGQVGQGGMTADTAATGLALLAFLGAGYTHDRDKYREVVRPALEFLITHQQENGDLFSGVGGSKYTWLYSHGIASIALCEAYGMTQDPALKDPAERALEFIIASQDPEFGGWRYAPGVGSDTSVSGWQMMALKSGELAGLQFDKSCYIGVRRWLDRSLASNSTAYIYRPGAEQIHQRTPSLPMTAEGMLMRLYVDKDKRDSGLLSGAKILQKNLPGTRGESTGTYSDSGENAYYWYYGTQILFQLQGQPWEDWNNALRPHLVSTQEKDGPLAGSWDPQAGKGDRWGTDGGRIYLTCLNLLMLEIYYRNLPLYADQGE